MNKIKKRDSSWLSDKVYLKTSGIEGTGIFTAHTINEGEIVSAFGGKIYTFSEIYSMPEDSFIAETATQISNEFFLGPLCEDCKEAGFFINHSCEPNCYVFESVLLISLRKISPDEEITFDYATCHNKTLDFECKCESTNCRKFISNNDYLDPEFQNKNIRYMPKWLQQEIERRLN